MSLDRRDLITREDIPSRPEIVAPESNLMENADKGSAYVIMTETRGWKKLVEEFINPRLSIRRVLDAPAGAIRNEVCGELKSLDELLKYVSGAIEEGQKAAKQLELLRKNRK